MSAMARALSTQGDTRCSIARSLEVLGQKWTLLIVREAMWGRTRYAEFRSRLGIAPDILSDRLATLVEHVLTAAGRDLLPVLTAFLAWGDEHRPTGYGPAAIPVEAASGRPLRLGYLDADGAEVPLADVEIARGPGAT